MSRTITTIDATDGRIVTDLTWRDLTNPYLGHLSASCRRRPR